MVAREQPGEKRLVAYVTADGRRAEIAALRRTCCSRLPDYMVPSRVVRARDASR